MSLFEKTTKIVFHSAEQRDHLVEKLQDAHIRYRADEDKASVFSNYTDYIVKVRLDDLKKVI